MKISAEKMLQDSRKYAELRKPHVPIKSGNVIMDPDLDLGLTLYKVKDKTNNMVIIHAMASWTTSFQSGLFVNVLLCREEETKQRDPFSHILR